MVRDLRGEAADLAARPSRGIRSGGSDRDHRRTKLRRILGPHAVTPAVLQLKRKENHVVAIELEGYQPYSATFTRSVSGWVVGNLVFGGLIGLVVDAATGGLYKLSPEQIAATLGQTGAVDKIDDVLYIGVVLRPDPAWERIGALEPVSAAR